LKAKHEQRKIDDTSLFYYATQRREMVGMRLTMNTVTIHGIVDLIHANVQSHIMGIYCGLFR